MFLFVYGTLLDIDKATRILKDGIIFTRKAFLPGYELVFDVESINGTGNPNIRKGKRGVWGAVYEINGRCLELLDKISPRYRRIEVEVIVNGKPVKAWTYVGKSSADVPPDRSCVEMIVKGAKYHGLPEEYIRWLESLLDSGQ